MKIPFKRYFNVGKAFLTKHSADILTGFTAAGVVITALETRKATLKAEEYLRVNGYDQANPDTQKVLKWESRRSYIVPAVVGGATIGAAIGANYINHKQIAGLAAACTVAETALNEHRDKIQELLGDKTLKEIDDNLSLEKAEKSINMHRDIFDDMDPSNYEKQLCCETSKCNRPFWASRADIERARNSYNEDVIATGGECYAVFLENCGATVPRDHDSNFVGHNAKLTGPLVLEFSSGIDEVTGRTYLAFKPRNPPVHDYLEVF